MWNNMVSEQRLVRRLSDYWERLRDDTPAPTFGKFRNADIADMWDFCFVLSVEQQDGQKKIYRYEYVGNRIVQAFGEDPTGQHVTSSLPNAPGVSIIRKTDDCVKDRQLLTEDGKFINHKNKVVRYRSCLMPFLSGDAVSHVIVGLSWKAF